MTLLVLFRTRLEWCNYRCGYCPWNADVVRVPPHVFQEDEVRLNRIVDRIAELTLPVEFFITPKAEYLVLPYWRDAVRRLLAMPHVRRVTIQTNLSFDVAAWLPSIAAYKLALWTTYHPTEVDDAGLEQLHAKWAHLRRVGVPFSVGIVGTRENLSVMHTLRARLPNDVYLWVNAYKREADYYRSEELNAIRAIDPYFDLNDQHFPSRGRLCNAGSSAVYLDDTGDIRRCFFVGDVLGNIFRDGWTTLPEPTTCPVATCHCYVGHMHIVELGFRSIYGENLAARIPLLRGIKADPVHQGSHHPA